MMRVSSTLNFSVVPSGSGISIPTATPFAREFIDNDKTCLIESKSAETLRFLYGFISEGFGETELIETLLSVHNCAA